MTSSKYIFTSLKENPRAVAVVLGHLGIAHDLYQIRNCATIAARSPPFQFMMHRLESVAVDIVRQAASTLRSTPPSVPLLIHLFSNGGAFLLEDIEQILQRQDSSLVSRSDAELVSSRMKLGYQFFDSCPCYLHNVWHPSYMTNSYPSPNWTRIGRSLYFVGSACSLTLWCTFTLALRRPDQFWNRMLHSNATEHQVYVYTTADMLSDAARVDELVRHRQDRWGVDSVSVHRYEDSDHCRLLRDHEDEYQAAIQQALEAACDRALSNATPNT